MLATSSTAPPPAPRCPNRLLGAVTGVAPSSAAIAVASALSMSIVPTPWAFTWPIMSGSRLAWLSAARIACRSDAPVTPSRRALGSQREAHESSRPWIVAPRRSAWARDSSTTTAAPSPFTRPSRSRSNGRQARWKSSARCESRASPRATSAVGCSRQPVPPLSITSAQPRSITLAASASASRLETSPSTIELLGPRASCAIAMCEAVMFGRCLRSQSGWSSSWIASDQSWKSKRPSLAERR